MTEKKIQNKLIVAIDKSDIPGALKLVEQLRGCVGLFKIGLEFMNSIVAGIAAEKSAKKATENARNLRQLFRLLDGKIFWDGKLADIPNTAAKSIVPLKKIGVKMFTVHASAGKEALKQAALNKGKAKVLGVTVLTSIDEEECEFIFGQKPQKKILQFADMLLKAEADGIVCSPRELVALNKYPKYKKLLKITPGIRPTWADKNDQKRTMAPGEAIKAGADYLVVGRPITRPPKNIGGPVEAVKKIIAEIEKN